MGRIDRRRGWRGSFGSILAALAAGLSVALVLALFSPLAGIAVPSWLPAITFLLLAVVLAAEVVRRARSAHAELRSLRRHLERIVEDRTEELSQANLRLQAEIAERLLAEEAMRLLERAVEQSIDGLLVTDAEGSTQFLNESWAGMHGYRPAQVLGHDLRLYHTTDQLRGELEPALEEARRSGAFEGEIGHRRRDGSTFPTWTSVTLLHDPEGEAEGFVIFARDITARRQAAAERRQLEEKVRRLQRFESLASLAGAIGHNYRKLLGGALGSLSLARREVAVDSMAAGSLEQITAAVSRAVELTDQLLVYAGAHPLEARTLDLGELVAELEPTLAATLDGRARFEVHQKRHLPPIEADPAQLRQVLHSLVANAVDALEDGGTVSVRTTSRRVDRPYLASSLMGDGKPEGIYVLLSVSDTGQGMDETTRERMFDPFFSTRSEERGLGLAAVLGIVHGHAGTIRVFSRPGRGTTLELLFPAVGRLAPDLFDLAPVLQHTRTVGSR